MYQASVYSSNWLEDSIELPIIIRASESLYSYSAYPDLNTSQILRTSTATLLPKGHRKTPKSKARVLRSPAGIPQQLVKCRHPVTDCRASAFCPEIQQSRRGAEVRRPRILPRSSAAADAAWRGAKRPKSNVSPASSLRLLSISSSQFKNIVYVVYKCQHTSYTALLETDINTICSLSAPRPRLRRPPCLSPQGNVSTRRRAASPARRASRPSGDAMSPTLHVCGAASARSNATSRADPVARRLSRRSRSPFCRPATAPARRRRATLSSCRRCRVPTRMAELLRLFRRANYRRIRR